MQAAGLFGVTHPRHGSGATELYDIEDPGPNGRLMVTLASSSSGQHFCWGSLTLFEEILPNFSLSVIVLFSTDQMSYSEGKLSSDAWRYYCH
jgi:hypothetical protein